MKKLLCLVLALTMVITSFTFVLADDYGKTHLRKPVEISSVNDLKNMAAIVNTDKFGCEGETFILTNDLDLGGEAWNRWLMGSLDNPFRGTFDGNGYVIKNFSMNCNAKIGYGIFAVVGGNGVIKNLGIEKATAKATTWSEAYGGAVGYLKDNAKVINCYAKEVRPTATSAGYMIVAGGLVGCVDGAGAQVINCYSVDCAMDDGIVNNDGGLIGMIANCAKIENCYSNTSFAKAISSETDKIVNCYSTDNSHWAAPTVNHVYVGTKVTDDELRGLADELGEGYIEGTAKTDFYPALFWQEIEVEETFGAAGEVVAVNNLAKLQSIKDYATTAGMTFKLTDDIDLNGADWNEYVIGTSTRPFMGTFDGNGHKITNFKFKSIGAAGERNGLFGVIGGSAIVKNLGIEDVEVYYGGVVGPFYSGSYFAGLVGEAIEYAKVDNCYVKNFVIDTKDTTKQTWAGFGGDQPTYSGSLIAFINGSGVEVTNCYQTGWIEKDDSVSSGHGLIGAIAEGMVSKIENCYSDEAITSCYTVDVSKVTNCYAMKTSGWSPYGNLPGINVTTDTLKTKAEALGEAFTAVEGAYPKLLWEVEPLDVGPVFNGTYIENATQLKALKDYPTTEGMSFRLAADIDLGGEDWNDYVIGTPSNPFKGKFDGYGHKITNFKFKSTGASGLRHALFGVVGGAAVIKNLGVENVEVYYGVYGPTYSQGAYGGLVAEAIDSARIEHCYVKNFVIDTKDTTKQTWAGWAGDQPTFAGSLIGLINGSGVSVKNCYQTGWAEIDDSASSSHGLIGAIYEGMGYKIENCYSDEAITSCNTVDVSKIVNCYAMKTSGWSPYGNLPGINVTTETLKDKAEALGSGFIANANGYPKLYWEENPVIEDEEDSGLVGEKPVIPECDPMVGTGAKANPYILTEAGHILDIAEMESTKDKYFVLGNDIDVNSAVITTPIENFEGYFNGNGYEIKNFELVARGSTGIFANIKAGAKITDLGVKNVNIVSGGTSDAGALIGIMEGGAVTNCYIRNLWFNSGNFATGGGLIGKMTGGSVVDCYSSGVVGLAFVDLDGGLIGVVTGADEVVNCYSDTTLTRTSVADKFKNVFQKEVSKETGYTWPATVTDTTKLSYNFANAFTPRKTTGPKLKSQIYGDYVDLVGASYVSGSATYNVAVKQDAYYRISALSGLTGVTFDGVSLDLNGGSAVYAKADESKTVAITVTGNNIKNLRVVKVDIDAEMEEAEKSIVLDAPINKVIDVDFTIEILDEVCGGVAIDYETENGYIDLETGFVSADVEGYGVAKDTITATVNFADKQVVKSMEIGLRKKAPYEILNAGLVNADGDTVYSVKKAVKIDTVYVNKNTTETYDLYAALYKGDKLLKVARSQSAGTEFKFDVELGDADKVKLFVIDGATVMPLALPFTTYAPTTSTDKITVHTVGDSLCQTYNPDETDLVGWGQLIGGKFSVDNVTVDNSLARSGMYAKEFVEKGRLNNLLKRLQKGDYVLIQLAINDMYQHIPIADFKAQMNQIVSGVIEKGAIPVLITSPDMIQAGTATNEKGADGKYIVRSTIANQVNVVREIAKTRQIPLIDHTKISHELFAELGYDGVKNLGIYVADELHYNAKGAEWVTNNIVTGLVELGLPLGDFVVDATGVYEFESGAIDASGNVASGTTLRVAEFVGINDITSVEVGSGYNVAWYAYDKDKNFVGASDWLKEFSTAEVKAEVSDAAFVKFVIKNTNGGAVTKENSGVKISKGYGVIRYTYEGKSLNTNNELSYEYQFRGMSGQDGDIYGDYLFRFGPKGEGKVYSISNKTEVGSIVLDKKDIINPHNNTTCFGNEFYAEGDEFPLLYSCMCDNMNDTTTVYRIVRNGNTFTTKLVQVIVTKGTSDSVVDAQNGKYYAYDSDADNITKNFYEFDLPKLADGVYNSTYGVNVVTLNIDEALSHFTVDEGIYVGQGATVHDNKLYLTSGFTHNKVYLTVIDLETQEVHCRINLEEIGLVEESEFIAFKDGVMYLMPVYGNIYTFKFY